MAEMVVDKKWTENIIKMGVKGRLCVDCGEFDIGYAVKTPVWVSAIRAEPQVSSRKRICINCLQKRIGRKLVIDDFHPTANEQILFGYTLRQEEEKV